MITITVDGQEQARLKVTTDGVTEIAPDGSESSVNLSDLFDLIVAEAQLAGRFDPQITATKAHRELSFAYDRSKEQVVLKALAALDRLY